MFAIPAVVSVRIIIEAIGFGLVTGSLLTLGAVGFTLQFSITNVFNLAYAEVMGVCAFVAYVFNQQGLNIWSSMAIGAVTGAILSVGLNRMVYAPFIRKLTRVYETLIVTLSVGLVISNIMLAIVGPGFVTYTAQPGATVNFADLVLTVQQIELIGLAFVCMVAIHLLLKRTKLGTAMRATANNPALARSSGIRTQRVVDVAWFVSGALCGIAGVAVALNTTSFGVSTESEILVLIIAAAVLGGVGSPYGAMLGAVIVGVSTELAGALINPVYKDVVALVLLLLILLARPQGLLGARGVREVVRCSSAVQFYIATLLVYAGVDIMLAWAANMQYGLGGILNLSFIVFQAVGGYVSAVLTLGPASGNGGFQRYIFGTSLPFPLPVILSGLVGGLVASAVGLIVLHRLRSDYQAMALLVIAVIATAVVSGDQTLFNGAAGLSLIPQPLSNSLGLSTTAYQWVYVGWTLLICGVTYLAVSAVTSSPLGRAIRASRDQEDAAEALGRDVLRLRLKTFVFGGVIAAVAGAVLVQFISAWAPGSWLYTETIVVLSAVIVGGTGNNLGVMVGALLVPVTFSEITRYIPAGTASGIIEPMQRVVIGLLVLGFLWARPQGVLPERRRIFAPGKWVEPPHGAPPETGRARA